MAGIAPPSAVLPSYATLEPVAHNGHTSASSPEPDAHHTAEGLMPAPSPQLSVDRYSDTEDVADESAPLTSQYPPSPFPYSPYTPALDSSPVPGWVPPRAKEKGGRARSPWLGKRPILLYGFGLLSVVLLITAISGGSKSVLHELKQAASEFVVWEDSVEEYKLPDKSLLVNFDEPQQTFRSQLKHGVRYVTCLAYGGHANQFLSIGKLLYFAKITNRVAIIPTLNPIHFKAPFANMSDFFDLPRFFHLSDIYFTEMSAFKPLWPPTQEQVPCWSVQEATVGIMNGDPYSLTIYNIAVNYWPLPPLAKAQDGGRDLAFDALRVFDSELGWQKKWIAKAKAEFIPQNPVPGGGAFNGSKADNLKAGFKLTGVEPEDQFLCLDNSLFIGSISFPELLPGTVPLEGAVDWEGTSWQEGTRYMYFNKAVEDTVDRYLMKIFGVSHPSQIPPFISIHLRRGDFKLFRTLTPLQSYQNAVEAVRTKLQARLDAPKGWRGPGFDEFKDWGIKAKDYAVLTTTDEPTGSEFIAEVRALGWKVLDHGEEQTEEKLGGWWPTILDSAVLARGSSFVGTEGSTFSYLAGLRVK